MGLRVNGTNWSECDHNVYVTGGWRNIIFKEDRVIVSNDKEDEREILLKDIRGIQYREDGGVIIQAQMNKVRANGKLVWEKGCKGKAIKDLKCTDYLQGVIRVTFTPPNTEPTPRLFLYDGDALVKEDVYSGFEYKVADEKYHELQVITRNEKGTTASNKCRGKAIQHHAAGDIKGFEASDNLVGKIRIDFKEADKEDNWVYYLIRSGSREIVASDVYPGYEWITDEHDVWLAVMAENDYDRIYSKGDKGSAFSAPSKITDFKASKDKVGGIKVTFSPADGWYKPTYDLIDADTERTLATNIKSGFEYRTNKAEYRLRVDARNNVGVTPSNEDTGKTIQGAGKAIYTESGKFTVPRGYDKVFVCMVGGGGGGSSSDFISAEKNFSKAGGGYAGEEKSGYVDVTPGEEINVIIGMGGRGYKPPTGDDAYGQDGFNTAFKGMLAKGGKGGGPDGYLGVGHGVKPGCGGSGTRDGFKGPDNGCINAYGGQGSSFGNGGDGVVNVNIKLPTAGVGAGGGAAVSCRDSKDPIAGDGGRGEVRIYWGTDTEIEEMLKEDFANKKLT